jgi:hypothetical protein
VMEHLLPVAKHLEVMRGSQVLNLLLIVLFS